MLSLQESEMDVLEVPRQPPADYLPGVNKHQSVEKEADVRVLIAIWFYAYEGIARHKVYLSEASLINVRDCARHNCKLHYLSAARLCTITLHANSIMAFDFAR